MPQERPLLNHEGHCRCTWCFKKIDSRRSCPYKANYLCEGCANMVRLSSTQRCTWCMDVRKTSDLILDWQTGKWFCKKCWKSAHPDEGSEMEFFNRPLEIKPATEK